MKKLVFLLTLSAMLFCTQQGFAQKVAKTKASKETKAVKTTTKGRVEVREKSSSKQKVTPEVRAQEWTDNMNKYLSLNSDQRKKIYDINLLSAQTIDKVKTTGKRSELKTLHSKRENDVKALLTPDQINKLNQFKSKMSAKRK